MMVGNLGVLLISHAPTSCAAHAAAAAAIAIPYISATKADE